MKLQLGLALAVFGMVGCAAGTIEPSGVGGNGETTADLRIGGSVAKRRDLRPARTPFEKLQRATVKSSRLSISAPTPQAAGAAAVQPSLTYRNGPLLQSVQIYAVFWGPNVDSGVQSGVPGFFGGITSSQSAIMSMLSEYNTNGMTIGSGTFMGVIHDDDAPIPADGIIDDTMIGAEAARLADLGKGPGENGNNIYMIFFPPGVKIDQGGGTFSCQVFCAYHNSFTRNGNNFYYGVIPDQGSGGCEQGCGTHDALNNTYSTSSHELIEAITDAAVGANSLAWYDDNFGEIGDICVDWDGTASGYTVQSEWSNASNGCTDHAASTNATITVTYNDTATTAAGASATFSLSSSGTATGALTLATSLDGQTGFTSSWSPATINVGGASTLTLTVPSTLRSQDLPVQIQATDGNTIHHFAQATVHVVGAAPTITSVTPAASGSSQGGNLVTLVGTNFGPGATAKVCSSSTTPCSTGIAANGSYVNGSNGTKFQLTMPSHAAASVKIWVINANDTTHPAKVAYTYSAGQAPTVASVDPPSGPAAGNTFITITGTNFSSNSKIQLGTTALDCDPTSQTQNCSVQDDKTAVAITPMASAGQVAVTVTNADGLSGSLANAFEYGKSSPPSIASLSVATGPTAGGTYVTIFGKSFDSPTVTFDGMAATVKTVNPSFIGVLTPTHAAGMVDVVVANGDAQTSKSSFTYDDSAVGGDMGGPAGGGNGGNGGGGAGGGNGDNGGTISGTNHIAGQSSGCSFGGNGDSASAVSLILVFAALAFALRRQRS